MEYNGFSRKKFIVLLIFILLVLLAGGYVFLTTQFNVTQVEVDGNEHYTEEEIKEMIMPGGILDNSLYLNFVYRNKEMKDVPFVESMDVEIISNHSIRINVYEKALDGCISYLGSYMYFDREGIVVESASSLTEGVPQIKGLRFDHVVMHEKLPVEDKEIFAEILKVTQLLGKYSIAADQIYFSAAKEITLYFDKAKVYLGTDVNIDEKVVQLGYILPDLEGKSGTLHMENYDENTTNITFEPD